ncbi:MAG: hypothetical protein WCL07_00620 [bacterium]
MLKNIIVLASGTVITMLILGLSSGVLTTWVKDLSNRNVVPAPSPIIEPIASTKPSSTSQPSRSPVSTKQAITKVKSTPKPIVTKAVGSIVTDQQAPTMNFEGPWKNGESQTCVKVVNISDNITQSDRLTKSERMDNNDWRDLHSEYCLSGNRNDTHKYQVRVKDEQGNEATSTFTFPIL